MTSWNPNANDDADTFSCCRSDACRSAGACRPGGVARANLAAIDLTTGLADILETRPGMHVVLPRRVRRGRRQGSTVYVAGSFTTRSGVSRANRSRRAGPNNRHRDLMGAHGRRGAVRGCGRTARWPCPARRSISPGPSPPSTAPAAAARSTDSSGTLTASIPRRTHVSCRGAWQRRRLRRGLFQEDRRPAAEPGGGTRPGHRQRDRVEPERGRESSAASVASGSAWSTSGGDFYASAGRRVTTSPAIDATTGLATGWNPVPGFAVGGRASRDGIVYASGPFRRWATTRGTTSRPSNAPTGHTTAWNAEINPTRRVDGSRRAAAGSASSATSTSALRYSQRSFAAIGPSGPSAGPRITHYQFNDPTIVPIEPQTTKVNTPTPALPFRVSTTTRRRPAWSSPAFLVQAARPRREHRDRRHRHRPDRDGDARTGPARRHRDHADRQRRRRNCVNDVRVIVEGDAPPNTPPTISADRQARPRPQGTRPRRSPSSSKIRSRPRRALRSARARRTRRSCPHRDIVFGGSGAHRTVT